MLIQFSFRFLPGQSKAAGTRGLSRFSSTLKNPPKAKPRVATYAASHALNLEVIPCSQYFCSSIVTSRRLRPAVSKQLGRQSRCANLPWLVKFRGTFQPRALAPAAAALINLWDFALRFRIDRSPPRKCFRCRFLAKTICSQREPWALVYRIPQL